MLHFVIRLVTAYKMLYPVIRTFTAYFMQHFFTVSAFKKLFIELLIAPAGAHHIEAPLTARVSIGKKK